MIAWIVLAIGAVLISLLSISNWKIIHDRDIAEKEKRLAAQKAKENPDAFNENLN